MSAPASSRLLGRALRAGLVALVLFAALGGCGQTGPLVLPDSETSGDSEEEAEERGDG